MELWIGNITGMANYRFSEFEFGNLSEFLLSWDIVCKRKRKGWLGITDCVLWNEAATGKYVWNIANKVDNLWVKWITMCIKGADWWEYTPK